VLSDHWSVVSLERFAENDNPEPLQIHQQFRSYREAEKLSANSGKNILAPACRHAALRKLNKTQLI
jgi:hypothetical protein